MRHMINCAFSLVLGTPFALPLMAQEMGPKDHLRQMAGCFRVTFNYVEDGVHDKFYAPVLEKSEIIAEDPLTFRRTLVIEGEEQLHWTDTWTEGEGGMWHQKVVGPFDDFRYECEGAFVQNQWTCLAPRALKPRRDAERPYEYLNRHNTLQFNSLRWIHVQNNEKIAADGSLYSVEVGWNQYDRRPLEECIVGESASLTKGA